MKDPWPATTVNTNQESWGEQEKDLWGGVGSSLRKEDDQALIGSPLKKQRASMSGENEFKGRVSSLGGVSSGLGAVTGLGMGFLGGGADAEFGGELKKVDEVGGPSVSNGGIGAANTNSDISGSNNVGPAAMAAVGAITVSKGDDMEEEL